MKIRSNKKKATRMQYPGTIEMAVNTQNTGSFIWPKMDVSNGSMWNSTHALHHDGLRQVGGVPNSPSSRTSTMALPSTASFWSSYICSTKIVKSFQKMSTRPFNRYRTHSHMSGSLVAAVLVAHSRPNITFARTGAPKSKSFLWPSFFAAFHRGPISGRPKPAPFKAARSRCARSCQKMCICSASSAYWSRRCCRCAPAAWWCVPALSRMPWARPPAPSEIRCRRAVAA
mmetsp:Transcript_166347/g.534298  ORF Transcript_166347/g.534298 Transcript_166347/m.534298 type:complete len:229 (+) Transcript_166347:422-1108(+)